MEKGADKMFLERKLDAFYSCEKEKPVFSGDERKKIKKIVFQGVPDDILSSEAKEQLLFVLESTLADSDFVNHCDKAILAFGKNLSVRFGQEESFFDLAKKAEFKVAQSFSSLPKTGYRGDYHRVGVLRIGKHNLVFDLNYGEITPQNKQNVVSIAYFSGKTDKEIIDFLKKNYGGNWELLYNFNQNGIPKYQDKN